MARMPRLVVPGFPHHVTQRGNRRQKTFFCRGDYLYYIALIAEYARQADTEIWAYCLMPNHIHLVMVPHTEDGLRAALGEAHRHYTRHINLCYGWRGHLWQERFHSFLMDENYLRATVRYVERNPVAAGLCDFAGDWQWSSASAHLEGMNDGLVRVSPMLERIPDWNAFLSSAVADDGADLIRRHTRTGRPLGSPAFIEKLEAITGKVLAPKRRGRKPALKK